MLGCTGVQEQRIIGQPEKRIIRGGCLGSSVMNPSHWPLLYRWEGQGELVQLQFPSATFEFFPKLKRALITQSTKCPSARSGEGSPTYSKTTLCTQPEHSFPLSPNRETRCGVPVRPQSLSSAVFSCPFHIDIPAGCSGSDVDGVGAVAAVLWSLVHRGLCLSGCR